MEELLVCFVDLDLQRLVTFVAASLNLRIEVVGVLDLKRLNEIEAMLLT